MSLKIRWEVTGNLFQGLHWWKRNISHKGTMKWKEKTYNTGFSQEVCSRGRKRVFNRGALAPEDQLPT